MGETCIACSSIVSTLTRLSLGASDLGRRSHDSGRVPDDPVADDSLTLLRGPRGRFLPGTPSEGPKPLPPLPTGAPRRHGFRRLRETLRDLTVRRLDGRSKVAVAVRTLKAEIAADLGGDLSKAQTVILEDVATTWIIRSTLDDFILRQPSITTKKRALLPVVAQRMQVAEHLARQLDRLGLKRVPKPVETLADYLRRKEAEKAPGAAP
jgi:hypothetical protein